MKVNNNNIIIIDTATFNLAKDDFKGMPMELSNNGYSCLERFVKQTHLYLKPNGKLLSVI